MKILFVLPELCYSGGAKQLMIIAPALPPDRFEIRVCVLGKTNGRAETLHTTGVQVDTLRWTRRFDATPFLLLRQVVRGFQPDVIHVWGLSALRAVLPAAKCSRLVVGRALPSTLREPALSRFDRWLLRRTHCALACSQAEAESYRRLGVSARQVLLIPPGVGTQAESIRHQVLLKAALGLSEHASLLVCVGPLEARKGFRDAIWAMDILKYVYDNLHLVLIGDGPERQALERFAHSIRVNDRVHFLGELDNASAILSQAQVVWVPSVARGGSNVALEAMAAGRPVVAGRVPELAEIVVDGETGFVVSSGDKVALARRTRMLLADSDLRERLGRAGQERARRDYSVAALVRAYAGFYQAAVA